MPKGSGFATRLSGVALWVAIIVLIAFGAFTAFMIAATDGPEVRWSRLAWLFASVEAIAFGAAGAIFGSSIQRERAEKAEASAERNAEAAHKGQALAASLKAEGQAHSGGSGVATRGLGGDGDDAAVAKRHAALAQELFPD